MSLLHSIRQKPAMYFTGFALILLLIWGWNHFKEDTTVHYLSENVVTGHIQRTDSAP